VVYARGGNAGHHAPAATEVRDTQALERGHLTVGIPPMINLLFTPVLKAFRQRHPNITLTLQEDAGQAIERQVAQGDLEIGMTVLPADPALGCSPRPSPATRSGRWQRAAPSRKTATRSN
jgi:DNA-binding transcriptional LysR family regulator